MGIDIDFYFVKNNCINLRDSIKNHNHYGPCLNGSKYNYFSEKCKDLDKCIHIFDKATQLEENIIKENNNLEIQKKKKYQSEELSNKKYESMKEQFKNEEDLEKKKNDEFLKHLEEKNKIYKKKAKNELEDLEKGIIYLKDLINDLDDKKEGEIKKKQEELLNNLEHEYDLKLDKYERDKELQRLKEEEHIRCLEKEFKNKIEYELVELRKRAELVNKTIYRFKFILNN